MSVLIKVNDKLWINPNALQAVELVSFFNGHGYEDGACIQLNSTHYHVPAAEWAVIESLVTLPARAAKDEAGSSASSSEAQAVEEIIEEEAIPAEMIEPATEEELASQGGDSSDYLDLYDDDDDEWDAEGYDHYDFEDDDEPDDEEPDEDEDGYDDDANRPTDEFIAPF